MSRIRILVVKVDDDNPDAMSELASFDMPEADLDPLTPETALDDLEASPYEVGTAALKRVLQARWEEIDQQLAAKYRPSFSPLCQKADGHQNIKVARRFGTRWLSGPVLAQHTGRHVRPGNALLPAHEGQIITRGLQEWACLVPQDLPFAPVARLLGGQSLDAELICQTPLPNLVRAQGHRIRQAEASQVQALLSGTHVKTLSPELVVASRAPRRRAGWPQALCEAVDTALIAGAPRPPEGVWLADWDRVLFVRRAQTHRCATDLGPWVPRWNPTKSWRPRMKS